MLKVLHGWFNRYFSDEQAVILLVLLLAGLAIIVFLGAMLTPVFASIVIAFVLQGPVAALVRRGLHHNLAVAIVFTLFLGALVATLFGLVPVLWRQLTGLVAEFPRMVADLQAYIELLPQAYPQFFSKELSQQLFQQAALEASTFGQWLVSVSLSKIPNLIGLLIYLVLMPILVFFLLKDRAQILQSLSSMLPAERRLMTQIWNDMNQQFANYIRGKVMEIIIVGAVTYVAFVILGLNYAALLAILVGLSVVIPYIGAVAVTVPVAMVGFFQWGWGSEFITMMAVYGIIQAIDGNVLVPLLFSEVVNLHPVSIIIAVLVFGGIWGFWGIFFAIPLATMFKAIFTAWPRTSTELEGAAQR